MNFVVATFYHFFPFAHYAETQQPLLDRLTQLQIRGSLLLAPEGINSTLAGSREAIDAALDYLKREIVGGEFTHKESLCDHQPFSRTKVRLKKETISLGEPAPLEKIGRYVAPREWNALMDDPEVILLDARNDYETHLGSFKGAVIPPIHTFKELPDFIRHTFGDAKKRKIASFCTGGIRCEKLTAWMADQGFEEVYHLQGGILQYMEDVPEEESRWQGECYVFDKRIAVTHSLSPTSQNGMCFACGHTLTAEDQQHADYRYEQHCPYCIVA